MVVIPTVVRYDLSNGCGRPLIREWLIVAVINASRCSL
jgi:hypothetical protein